MTGRATSCPGGAVSRAGPRNGQPRADLFFPPAFFSGSASRVSTDAGGFWWDVAVPEVSERKEVDAARRGYEEAKTLQRVGD